jgi:hypothetical protein
VSSSKQSPAGQHDGHALSVERLIGAPSEVFFDAFIAQYDSQPMRVIRRPVMGCRPGPM